MSITFVNKLNTEYYDEFYSRGLVAPSELKKETGFTPVATTAADGSVAGGASTFDVDDGSDFDATDGAGVFWGTQTYDIFDFASRTSNTFSTVTGVDYAHADDSIVAKLYKLPSDFGRFRPGRGRGDGVLVGGTPYLEAPESPSTQSFSFYDNGTNKFLWLPKGVTSGNVLVIYDKSPSTLDSTDDTVDVPLSYEDYLVYGLVAKWKRILERDADVTFELSVQQNVIERAIKKRSAGKRIRAGRQFFQR